MQFAPPIEELLPGVAANQRAAEVDRQIRRLVPLIVHDLTRGDIPTRIEWRIPKSRYDPDKGHVVHEEETQTYHLIGNYFHLPRDAYATAFTEVIGKLDEGIGLYEELKRRAFWELFNPLAWLAHVLYAPVWVMQRAGLEDPNEPPSAVLRAYAWVLRALALIALVLLLTRLGLGDLIGTIIKAL